VLTAKGRAHRSAWACRPGKIRYENLHAAVSFSAGVAHGLARAHSLAKRNEAMRALVEATKP
jgi:hypothetical protein